MKKYLLFVCLVIFLLFISFNVKAGCVSTNYDFVCGDTINESCVMSENISTINDNGWCFDVGADNLIIDGNSYSITNDYIGSDYAIRSINHQNNIIKNFIITKLTYGIVLQNSSNNTITNNVMSEYDVDYPIYQAILLEDYSTNNTITNNILNLSQYGIAIWTSSSNNNITNNIIGNSSDTGISLEADNNNLINNVIVNVGTTGIALNGVSNNSLENNSIIIYGDYGNGVTFYQSQSNILVSNNIIISSDSGDDFVFEESTNNIISDSFFSNINGKNIYVYSGINNFTNCTFNQSNIVFEPGAGAINVLWYLDTYVKYDNGSIVNNAQVTGKDTNNNTVFIAYTDFTGYIPRQEVAEYFENNTGRFYLTKHSITATDGNASSQTQINLSTNFINSNKVTLTLIPTIVPPACPICQCSACQVCPSIPYYTPTLPGGGPAEELPHYECKYGNITWVAENERGGGSYYLYIMPDMIRQVDIVLKNTGRMPVTINVICYTGKLSSNQSSVKNICKGVTLVPVTTPLNPVADNKYISVKINPQELGYKLGDKEYFAIEVRDNYQCSYFFPITLDFSTKARLFSYENLFSKFLDVKLIKLSTIRSGAPDIRIGIWAITLLILGLSTLIFYGIYYAVNIDRAFLASFITGLIITLALYILVL